MEWSAHLELLHELRDGIHLRALAGEHPADAFHTLALREFDGFLDRVSGMAAERLQSLDIEEVRNGRAEVARPSATWTYMVSENPLGDPVARAMGSRRDKK
jgi:preprotein translocase subunit SecA